VYCVCETGFSAVWRRFLGGERRLGGFFDGGGWVFGGVGRFWGAGVWGVARVGVVVAFLR